MPASALQSGREKRDEIMSEANHTKGPWTVVAFIREVDGSAPTGRRARIVSECESADGYLISSGNASIADVARKGGLSDARLIAAAPELLEALQAFLRAPSIGSNGPGSVTIEVQTFNLIAARSAIEKAVAK